MKNIINIYLLLLVSAILSGNSYAKTTTAIVGSGNWGSAGTWDNGVPAEGDIIIIPNGAVVTVEFFTEYDFRGGGTTLITIQNGGVLNGVGLSVIRIDSVDGDLVTVEAGGLINPELAINFDGGIWPEVIISNLPIPGASTSVPGPAAIENGVLPITLIEFKAYSILNNVKLTWATASEENFDYFLLERSTDGKEFKEIVQITGRGNSIERNDYEFVDDFPLKGRSYYRLRAVDFDGYTEIFDYVMVEVKGLGNNFNIYPNPIQNSHFSLQTNFTEEARLIIYNNVGKVEKQQNVNDWMTDYYLDLSPGSYLFKMVTNSGVIVKRVLVK